MNPNDLWNSRNEQDWINALDEYRNCIRENYRQLEEYLDNLDANEINEIRLYNAEEWRDFLLEKYFH